MWWGWRRNTASDRRVRQPVARRGAFDPRGERRIRFRAPCPMMTSISTIMGAMPLVMGRSGVRPAGHDRRGGDLRRGVSTSSRSSCRVLHVLAQYTHSPEAWRMSCRNWKAKLTVSEGTVDRWVERPWARWGLRPPHRAPWASYMMCMRSWGLTGRHEKTSTAPRRIRPGAKTHPCVAYDNGPAPRPSRPRLHRQKRTRLYGLTPSAPFATSA